MSNGLPVPLFACVFLCYLGTVLLIANVLYDKISKTNTKVIHMPREARQKSQSGIYHILMKCRDKQLLFYEEDDYNRFLETVSRYKEQTGIKVYGWCLMSNHVHLLIKEGREALSTTMKRLTVSYAWYHKSKYDVTGHLFQDRYRSENVETDEYLLTVTRYIHQNPVRTELADKCSDWRWSSCRGYYDMPYHPSSLLDSEAVLSVMSAQREKAIEQFIEFNEAENKDECLEDTYLKRVDDEQAEKKIMAISGVNKVSEIKNFPKEERDRIIKAVKKADGITQRQIARLLGVSQSLVHRT